MHVEHDVEHHVETAALYRRCWRIWSRKLTSKIGNDATVCSLENIESVQDQTSPTVELSCLRRSCPQRFTLACDTFSVVRAFTNEVFCEKCVGTTPLRSEWLFLICCSKLPSITDMPQEGRDSRTRSVRLHTSDKWSISLRASSSAQVPNFSSVTVA